MDITTLPEAEPADARQLALLEAAVGVFARYGFRKTSMEEVARAAGVSRQGLYLQFANKEELFRKALEHSLNTQLIAAEAALSRQQEGLEQRLIAACDAWSGRFVGSLGCFVRKFSRYQVELGEFQFRPTTPFQLQLHLRPAKVCAQSGAAG